MTLRILLVDDHGVLRDGLRMILETQPDMRVVGTAANGRDAVRKTESERPDIVLMDISMPELNGIEATAQVRARHPDVRVIVLSVLATREHVYSALRAGATGYILKESLGREVIHAVRQVAGGHRYLGQGIADIVVSDAAQSSPIPHDVSPFEQLSSREMEVCQLLVEGCVPKEISDIIGISSKTVDTYRRRLMAKLGVDSLAALVKLAVRHRITPVDS